jgi:hypothetical protein
LALLWPMLALDYVEDRSVGCPVREK